MKKNVWITLLVALNVLVISLFLIWLLNREYPIIGHDNRLFMPYLLDSYLHQKINGLTVQWYTPSFVGGRPVYSNPQDLQFSLPQFLLWLVDPWIAIQTSMIVYVTIGFIATYYFLKKILGLASFAAILGAVFFVANGFFFEHMAAGHLTYQLFPLFAVVVVLLLHPKLPLWLSGVLLSLVVTIIFYNGVHNIPFFILSSLMFFPILYLIKPSLLNWRRILATVLWAGPLALLLNASRISAIVYFMRLFPRSAQDNYTTSFFTGTMGIVRQLLGTMNLTPLYRVFALIAPAESTYQSVVDMATSTGTVYGYWELDASLSPILVLLLAGGAVAYLLRKPVLKAVVDKKRLIAIACLILAVWVTIEFTLAKGLIYPYLRDLPILSSLRVNVRNISAFIFPLAIVGAVIFDRWTRNWRSQKRLWAVFLLADAFALAALFTYHWVPTDYALPVDYALGPGYRLNLADYRPILATYQAIRYEGETFPVKTVVPDALPWTVFDQNATSTIDPYNAYFKGRTSDQITLTLHAGPVSDVTDSRFNIIDPTGYIFPEANGTKMYERISVADEDKFLAFINRRQPDWKLPLLQQILDWTSLTAIVVVPLFLVLYLASKWARLPVRISRFRGAPPSEP